jgi:hypothetical protein
VMIPPVEIPKAGESADWPSRKNCNELMAQALTRYFLREASVDPARFAADFGGLKLSKIATMAEALGGILEDCMQDAFEAGKNSAHLEARQASKAERQPHGKAQSREGNGHSERASAPKIVSRFTVERIPNSAGRRRPWAIKDARTGKYVAKTDRRGRSYGPKLFTSIEKAQAGVEKLHKLSGQSG